MSLIPGASGVAASFPDGFTVSNGTVTAPGYKFSDSQTGFYRPGANEWALANNGVQSMLVSSAGAFTLGPTLSLNYNGPRHSISGFLYGIVGTAGVSESGDIAVGTNVRYGGANASAGRTDSTSTGSGIIFGNQTTNTAWAARFVANKVSDTTATNGIDIGQFDVNGSWVLGPTPGTSVFHTLNIGTVGQGGAPTTSAQASGSIVFKNGTNGSNAVPQMTMKTSSTNQSNYIVGAAHDTNSSGDLYFVANNQAGGTFSTLINKAFVWGADSEVGSITRSGAVTFPLIHNNAASGNIASGTYTPTFANVANGQTATPSLAIWFRIGNVVHVCGSLGPHNISAIGNDSQFSLTLPVARSNFTSFSQAGGSAQSNNNTTDTSGGWIAYANSGSQVILFQARGSAFTSTALNETTFQFTYLLP